MTHTLPSLLTLRQAADRLGITAESARKRAFRTKTLAPGVPVIQGGDNGWRFVRSTDIDSLIYGSESVFPAEHFVLASEAAIRLGVPVVQEGMIYPGLPVLTMQVRVLGSDEPKLADVYLANRVRLEVILLARDAGIDLGLTDEHPLDLADVPDDLRSLADPTWGGAA